MQWIMKTQIMGALVLGGTVCYGALLLEDPFDSGSSLVINDHLDRQSGTESPVAWVDTAGDDWRTQIDPEHEGGALRLYKNSAQGGSVSARLEQDFARVTNSVNISVSLKNPIAGEGFTMVNFGMAAADGFDATQGYRFQLDDRVASTNLLSFYEGTTFISQIDVSSLVIGGLSQALSINYWGGHTISATFNGQAFDFGGGATNYTGITEAENYVMLGWFDASGGGQLTSGIFPRVAVSSIPVLPPSGPAAAATIIGWSSFSSQVMKIVVETPSGAGYYYPESTANLTSGTWTNVPHSTNGLAPFIVSSMAYSSLEESNRVIYVETDHPAESFRIIGDL